MREEESKRQGKGRPVVFRGKFAAIAALPCGQAITPRLSGSAGDTCTLSHLTGSLLT